MTRSVQRGAMSFGVGLATVWHTVADWSLKLLFAVAVAIIATRLDHLVDYLTHKAQRKQK